MKLAATYRLDLIRNRTAEIVYEEVEEILSSGSGLCPCENCVLDIIAYVLNRVTPRYTTSLLGNLRNETEEQERLRTQIRLALTDGLTRLREHPHHEP